MSGFTAAVFEKKLNELNDSQQSIQTLSLLLIHHRRHYKLIVETWLKELKKVKPSKRLTFMYLANDVIQNSKKKGPEFSKEFLTVLKPAIEHIVKNAEESTKKSMDRILKIWEERGIYDKNSISKLRQCLHTKEVVSEALPSSKQVKRKHEDTTNNNDGDESKDKNGSKSFCKRVLSSNTLDTDALAELLPKISSLVEQFSVDLSKPERVEPEKLVKTIKELEKSPASTDQGMLQKIASMPPEVFDVKLLESKLEKEGKEYWSKVVEDAQHMLNIYNGRLAQEIEERKQLASMLAHFIEAQRRSLTETEQHLAEYRAQLRKVTSVREAIKSHLRNMPDLKQPTVAPLPSASDLFKI